MSAGQDDVVQVPDTPCPLDENNLTLLKQSVDFSVDDGNFGISLFNDTLAEVMRFIEVQRPLSP